MKSDQTEKAVVTLYTRPGCHLCEEAKANLLKSGCRHQFTLREVNIEEDQGLKERFQHDIPVIFINGIKVFKHQVNPAEFKRKLRRFLQR